jgi:hypothetical protein
MLGPALYDKYPTGARPKPGKDAIVSFYTGDMRQAPEENVRRHLAL